MTAPDPRPVAAPGEAARCPSTSPDDLACKYSAGHDGSHHAHSEPGVCVVWDDPAPGAASWADELTSRRHPATCGECRAEMPRAGPLCDACRAKAAPGAALSEERRALAARIADDWGHLSNDKGLVSGLLDDLLAALATAEREAAELREAVANADEWDHAEWCPRTYRAEAHCSCGLAAVLAWRGGGPETLHEQAQTAYVRAAEAESRATGYANLLDAALARGGRPGEGG